MAWVWTCLILHRCDWLADILSKQAFCNKPCSCFISASWLKVPSKPCSDVVFQVGDVMGMVRWISPLVGKEIGVDRGIPGWFNVARRSGKIHPNSCGIFVGKAAAFEASPSAQHFPRPYRLVDLVDMVVAGCCVEKTVSTCWNNAGCCVFMTFGWGAVRELRALALCVGLASFGSLQWCDGKPCFPVFDSKFGNKWKDTILY